MSMVIVPISSRKRVPPLATSKRPFFEATAEVKAPLTWPNRVDSRSSEGTAPVLTGTKGLVFAWGVGVKSFGNELLAGAAFALDEDGRTAEGATWAMRSNMRSMGSDLADDVLEVVALLEGSLEVDDLFFGLVTGDGGADVGEELSRCPMASGRSFLLRRGWHRRRCRRCRRR